VIQTIQEKILDSKLELNIKLRFPLGEHEFVTKTEKWAILDMSGKPQSQKPSIQVPSPNVAQSNRPPVPNRGSSNSFQAPTSPNLNIPSTSPRPSSAKRSPTSPQYLSPNTNSGRLSPPQPVKSPGTPAKSPALSPKSPVPSAKSPVSPTSSNNEKLDKLIEQFEDPSNMVSNEVLEYEQKNLQQQVVDAKIKKLPTYNELNDKLQAVTLQIQILVTNIESGILTMENYVKMLNEAIINTREMAKSFKKYGRIDLAKKALIRVKIMQKELEEGEEE